MKVNKYERFRWLLILTWVIILLIGSIIWVFGNNTSWFNTHIDKLFVMWMVGLGTIWIYGFVSISLFEN